jgi:2-oxoglutarate ferredoxin oxidoreductase subunit alpha
VQRGGPSTGLPTKTEQSDLMQAVYGRNGEAPLPVIAASSPSDCFESVFEACRIAIEHMTPVFFLSDGYIANGSEPWRFPTSDSLKEIKSKDWDSQKNEQYQPYLRDLDLVRSWVVPGTKGGEHRIGGLEKEDITGDVSYDPENHEKMVGIRRDKIEKIADYIPQQRINTGVEEGDLLVLSWGSTFGVVKTAVKQANEEGLKVGHAHLRYIYPFPKNLGDLLKKFKKVIIPEMNQGQLLKIIRSEFLIDAKGLNKIKGIPFTAAEIRDAIAKEVNS